MVRNQLWEWGKLSVLVPERWLPWQSACKMVSRRFPPPSALPTMKRAAPRGAKRTVWTGPHVHSKALWLQSFSLVSIYGKPYSEETQAALWRTPWSKKPRLPANSHVSDHLESGSSRSRKAFDDPNLGSHLDCSLTRNLLLEPPRYAASEFWPSEAVK